MAERIPVRNPNELAKMRKAGELLHSVLEALRAEIHPGVTTMHLDRMAEKLIRDAGAIPSFKGYSGFPYSICASRSATLMSPLWTAQQLTSRPASSSWKRSLVPSGAGITTSSA